MADGSKQRTYDGYDKSDGSSPKVVTESIFMTGVVDAKEIRNVAVLDIANAFYGSYLHGVQYVPVAECVSY